MTMAADMNRESHASPGQPPARLSAPVSRPHLYYVAFELAKVIAPAALGTSLLLAAR
jgi:hypothetical protein